MDVRIKKSRAALVAALLVLLREKPLDAISIRELTARAGVGYATFFRHHASIAELVGDITSETLQLFLDHTLPFLLAGDRTRAAYEACAHIEGERERWTSLLGGGAGKIVREQLLAKANELAVSIADNGAGPPRDLRIHFGVRGAVDIIAWWLLRQNRYSREEVAGFLEQLVIGPTVRDIDL